MFEIFRMLPYALLATCLSLPGIPVLAADGDLDTNFHSDGKVTIQASPSLSSWTQDLIVLLDGSVLLTGPVQIFANDYDFSVIKLKIDGSLDTTFGNGGVAITHFDISGGKADYPTAIARQSDGKVVVGGYAESGGSGGDYDFAVARFTANGTLDSTFGNSGKVVYPIDLDGTQLDVLTDLAIQPDGKIVLVGWAEQYGTHRDFVAVRLNSNGLVDTTFGAQGMKRVNFDYGGLYRDEAEAVVLQSDGKILLVGSSELHNSDYDFAIARLLPNGNLDPSYGNNGLQTVYFDRGGTKQDLAKAAVLDSAGRLVVAGHSEGATHSETDFAVARLLTNGTLDSTFGNNGKVTVGIDAGHGYDQATAVATAPNDQLIVTGRAHVTFSDVDFAAIRLNHNGTLDPQFGQSGKSRIPFNLAGSDRDEPFAMAVGLDGGIVIGGSVSALQNTDMIGVVKLQGAPWLWTWP